MSDLPRNVLVVDLSHLFWTKAFGMRAALAAADAVLADIRRIASNYDRVAIACDAKGPSFRASIFPAYKANRSDARTPDKWAALDTLKGLCARDWHVFTAPCHPDHDGYFYESDDVIAAIVAWCVPQGIPADVATGDSDLAQLVDDSASVRLVRVFNGQFTPMGATAVEAWQGVPPARILEVKALAGDGDGYKPFPGIGVDTAIKFLRAAPEFTARSVVESTIAAGVVLNRDGKTENKSAATIRNGGLARLEFGYAMARLDADADVHAERLFSPVQNRVAPGEAACSAMLAGLSKCESDIAAAAYGLVMSLDLRPRLDPWRLYGRMVEFSLRNGYDREASVMRSAEYLAEKFANAEKAAEEAGEELQPRASHACRALERVFRCFSAEDWTGMATFLTS